MTKVLIPRSDSISAKIIEPTDFTYLHSSDLIQNYIISGFAISAGSGLACNVAAGSGRLNGLYISSDATEAKSSLTASQTNSIYIKLDLDSGSQPEGWSLFSNTSGGAVTNAVLLGTAVTNGSAVTSVTNVITTKPHNFTTTNTEFIPFNLLGDQSLQNIGSGTAGDILYSNGTNWTKIAKGSDGQYLKLASGVPTWTTHTTPTTTITVQEDSMDADIHESSGLPGTLMSVTLPTRSGGYFMACASLSGSGDIGAYFKQGSTIISPRMGTGANETTDEQWSIFATGSLDGQVLSVHGAWNGNGGFSGSTDGDDAGYCHMTVFEVSQTS